MRSVGVVAGDGCQVSALESFFVASGGGRLSTDGRLLVNRPGPTNGLLTTCGIFTSSLSLAAGGAESAAEIWPLEPASKCGLLIGQWVADGSGGGEWARPAVALGLGGDSESRWL